MRRSIRKHHNSSTRLETIELTLCRQSTWKAFNISAIIVHNVLARVLLQLLDLLLCELLLRLEPIFLHIATRGDIRTVAGRRWGGGANLASIHTAEALVLHNEGRICVVELHAAALRGPLAAVPDAALHRHGPAHRERHVNLVALVVEDADHLVIHKPSAQKVRQKGWLWSTDMMRCWFQRSEYLWKAAVGSKER